MNDDADTFWSAHYARCQKYIYACAHTDEFGAAELRRLSAEQRIAEGEFQRALSGRKNIAYPKLCADVATRRSPTKQTQPKQRSRASIGAAGRRRRSVASHACS